MASNLSPSIIASKVTNNSKASTSSGQSLPAQSQAGSLAVGDNYPQRRSGSGGASSASRANPSPRNNQTLRRQHKGSKRLPKLGNEDELAGAMRSINSRKGQRTDITHLMNISLPPPPTQYNRFSYGRNARRAPTWGLGSGYHAVDKARWVHANYRFIVDPRTDCHVQSVDADVHLEWSNILQIIVSSQSQAASCPICLEEPPVAPRMAKCGHVFCLPCLIRFMHAEDETKRYPEKKAKSKKCPLCEDTIYTSETKPVRWYAGQEAEPPREGGDVVLRLVKRIAGSTLALPRDGAATLAKDEDVPWYFAAEAMDYARIMKGTEEYMTSQFEHDIHALEAQGQHDSLMFPEDTAEWTAKAIRMINESKDKIKGIGGPPSTPTETVPLPLERPVIEFTDSSDLPDMYAFHHAKHSGQSLPDGPAPQAQHPVLTTTDSTPSAPPLSSRPRAQSTTHGAPPEYFFYQALLHYYLSPLDIRILRESFGPFSSFPATILPRVERISTGHIVDDDLRKRTKYLSHLPYGCEVNFLECDWTDTVQPEILAKFQPEIERRRKRNSDKEALEEKARVNAEKDEEKRYAHLRRRRVDAEDGGSGWLIDEPSSTIYRNMEGNGGDSTGDENGASSSSPPWGTQRQGSSFASLADMSTSPSTSRTVWGTPAIVGGSPYLGPVISQPELQDDGWLQGWEKDLLHEDDLVAQAQAMSLSLGESSKTGAASSSIVGGNGAGGAGGAGGGGGGKKKKAKKITLMSTGVRRGA
ncbi:hypothetical protein EJ08DRAFT_677210 [Tothia fuscella]|uniref:RING-type domain-containing protein n=1 Tax=Tothia fuscella TaxID=1048955 RepID=A0A9P4NWM6_9PEZI|nr:hypothetical protein EJ08DRAFT_677210 [Tothia fuscella]